MRGSWIARAAVAGVSAFGEREGCAGCDCGCGVTTGAGCGAHAAARRRTKSVRFMQKLRQAGTEGAKLRPMALLLRRRSRMLETETTSEREAAETKETRRFFVRLKP